MPIAVILSPNPRCVNTNAFFRLYPFCSFSVELAISYLGLIPLGHLHFEKYIGSIVTKIFGCLFVKCVLL